MKTVLKYQLEHVDVQLLWMPIAAKLLHSDIQYGKMTLWFLVDNDTPTVCPRVFIYGTGVPIPDNHGEHVGTFVLRDGTLVLHAFMHT